MKQNFALAERIIMGLWFGVSALITAVSSFSFTRILHFFNELIALFPCRLLNPKNTMHADNDHIFVVFSRAGPM